MTRIAIRVDGYLSRRAAVMFPGALVYCDSSGPVEVWSLRWGGLDPIGIGDSFRSAKQGIEALIVAEKAKGEKESFCCPKCSPEDYASRATFDHRPGFSAGGTYRFECSKCGHKWTVELPAGGGKA